jgi:hypothetical protein
VAFATVSSLVSNFFHPKISCGWSHEGVTGFSGILTWLTTGLTLMDSAVDFSSSAHCICAGKECLRTAWEGTVSSTARPYANHLVSKVSCSGF